MGEPLDGSASARHGLVFPLPARITVELGYGTLVCGAEMLRDLDKELAAASARQGQPLAWSAQERAILAQISSILDRKAEFLELYEAAEDTKTKLKISAEVRLLEQAAARLIRGIKTDIEPAPSLRTVKARRAARARWDRDAHRVDADSGAGGYQLPGVYATLLAE